MTDWLSIPAVRGQDFALTLGDALHCWKLRGELKPLLLRAAVHKLLNKTAERKGIVIATEQLQAGANRLRAANGLQSAVQTHAWLAQRGLSIADLEAAVEHRLVIQELIARIPAAIVQAQFDKERDQFARMRLRQLTVASMGAARELLVQLTEEGADFGDLAREHSLDPASRQRGGDLGIVRRGQLPPSLADVIFAAEPGKVVGPVTTNAGVQLFWAVEFLPAELDAATASVIREDLFDAWLQNQIESQQIAFTLLDQV